MCMFILTILLSTSGIGVKVSNIEIGIGLIENKDTGETFQTIQAAIDDSDTSNGHTIFVPSGRYYENIVIDKSITLEGENKDETFIIANSLFCTISIVTDEVILKGFTFWNNIEWGHGLKIDHSSNTLVTNNLVIGNHLYGIWLEDSSYNTITDNEIISNGIGIKLSSSSNNYITNNTLQDSTWCNMWIVSSSNNNIYYNNFIIEEGTININSTRNDLYNSWDDGSQGNYWSDYEGKDKNWDKIGDTPYIIKGENNKDNYPWMKKDGKSKMINNLNYHIESKNLIINFLNRFISSLKFLVNFN